MKTSRRLKLLARGGWGRLPLALLVLSLIVACSNAPSAPEARQGRLDLQGWNFERHGSAPLRGEWEFYWDQLLTPQDFFLGRGPTPHAWLRLPSVWNGKRVDGKKLDGDGLATFRLQLAVRPSSQPMSLWVEEQSTAYKLWFDGKLVAQNGTVGPTASSSEPQVQPVQATVQFAKPRVDVVLQVGNRASAFGGATHAIMLGAQEVQNIELRRVRDLDTILFGGLLVMGLYHAGLFVLRRREKPALHIACICAAFGLRVPFFGISGRPLSAWAPQLPWVIYSALDALCVVWGFCSVVHYVNSVLDSSGLRATTRWATRVSALATVALVVLPRRWSELGLVGWWCAALAVSLYLLVVSFQADLRGDRTGRYLVAGGLGMAVAGIYEIVADAAGSTKTHVPVVPLGVFVFLMIQAWVVAIRLYAAFSAVESLSQELTLKNTELRRLESLKDEFLANTSHELRTPLHGIVGLGESLLRGAAGPLSRVAAENLRLIVSSGQRLASLITNLLDLSRIRRSDIQLKMTTVDARAVCSGVCALLEPLARAKGLALVNAVPSDLRRITADENRLHQILINLVGNAIKYTARGEVRLSALVRETELELTVADTGVGIPSDMLRVVFERSARLEHPGLDPVSGEGLGLGIARHLAKLHGGEICAESRVGEGSRFVVTLPAVPQAETANAEAVALGDPPAPFVQDSNLTQRTAAEAAMGLATGEQSASPRDDLPGPRWDDTRILVVDDDVVNLRVVENHLTLAGAKVRSASSGDEGLAIVRAGPSEFDLVLLDVMMPGLTGYEATRCLRESHTSWELPVILLTARSQPTDLIRGFEAGANDYLVKPFSVEELLARGRLHIQLKRAFRELEQKVGLEKELEQQRQREVLARLQAERASLEKLRYQLKPHFLFNALSSIRGAITADAQAAREMVSLLGDYCRLTLVRGQQDLLPLAEEFEMARLYLRMDQARKLEPIEVELISDPELSKRMVPSFLIQPLVENAVKFGRRTSEAGCLRIRISAQRRGSEAVMIRVSNSGRWLAPSSEGRTSDAVGLENTRQRLSHHFGDQARLDISQDQEWVHVSVELPSPSITNRFVALL